MPIALTILCGFLLVRTAILPREHWRDIEILSFKLLIPAILIKSIALSELSVIKFAPLIVALISTLVLAGLAVFLLRWLRSRDTLSDPAFTTIFQTTTRWNAFIALAAADAFVGAEGFGLIAIALAVLVPLINISNITILAIFGSARINAKQVALLVLKNPLVQASIIGIAINLSGIPLPTPIIQTLDLIGGAALGVGILAVGAGIDPARLLKTSTNTWLGVGFRLILCPAIFFTLAQSLQLGQTEMLAGMLIVAVPAAVNGYIIAKQMGGDADLYADILAWQTVLSMITLPILAVLLTL